MADPPQFSSYFKAVSLYGPGKDKKRGKTSGKSALAKARTPGSNNNNNELDLYYEIQRRENEAARVIQFIWKKARRLGPWRHAVKAMFAVVKIQKIIRGWVARRYVAKWFVLKTYMATQWQSGVRKYLVNKRLRPHLAMERAMAVRIQCFVRQFLARMRVQSVLFNLAASRIQALWRGVVARSLSDRMWLDRVVLPIQNAARRMNAMRKFGGQKKMLGQAALLIQRKFRTTLASNKINSILHERELGYRFKLIHMLTAEEEFYQQKLARLMARVIKNEVKDKAAAALRALQAQEEVILNKENEWVEVKRHAEILSPRAIEQGFRDELFAHASGLRHEISELKYRHLFEASVALHGAEEALESSVQEIEEIAANRARVARYREQEYEDRRHLDYHREQTRRKKDIRVAVAEEKRKWQVRFFTKSGKPDKRRRPGRPWDPSVFAGPEKSTYTGAGVDLLAFLRQDQAPGKSTDVQQNVNSAMQQVGLQTYLDQVNTYQQILNPIFLILQQYMGLVPGNPNDAVPAAGMKGFGEEGQRFKEALQTLDVQPPPRTRLKTRGKKEFTTFAFPNSGTGGSGADKSFSVDKAMGFVPPSASSSRVSSRVASRSVFSSGLDLGKETIEDIEYTQIDPNASVDLQASSLRDPRSGSPQIMRQGSALDQDSVSLAPGSPDESVGISQQDLSVLKPILEDILLPSKRYWKRPPKKYLPADDAFELPAKMRSVTSEPLAAVKSPRRPRSPMLEVTKPASSYSSKLVGSTSMSRLQERDPYIDMAAVVAQQQEADAQQIADMRAAAREERRRVAEKRKERKASRRRVGAIPWELLDELDGAAARQEAEIAHEEFTHQF